MTDQPADWDGLRGARISVPSHVVFRSFATETVLLNINTGMYHGMDTVGGRFFETMSAAASLEDAAEALAAEFEQPLERIAADLTRYCSELGELGLVQVHRP